MKVVSLRFSVFILDKLMEMNEKYNVPEKIPILVPKVHSFLTIGEIKEDTVSIYLDDLNKKPLHFINAVLKKEQSFIININNGLRIQISILDITEVED